MELQTLNVDEVLQIHNILVEDFESSDDPISPPGVRSEDLLISAVERQHTGIGDRLKYPDPVSNAATLLFGLCCNHAFHNGNKRTALVATLAHLDKNHLSLFDTRQSALYSFMLRVANHTVGVKVDRRRIKRHGFDFERDADKEVEAIAHWLTERVGKIQRGEHPILYRELRQILSNFGYHLENPKNNSIDVVRYVEQKTGLLRRKTTTKSKRVGNIPWPGENRQMAIRDIKYVREICRLREEDGVDSDAFYNYAVIIHQFVNRYRGVLRRLAKT